MMHKAATLVVLLSALTLAACVSGRPKPEAYTDKAGVVQTIENDREACESACDGEYDRCGESDAARRSLEGAKGLFGASAGCNKAMSSCLSRCKGR